MGARSQDEIRPGQGGRPTSSPNAAAEFEHIHDSGKGVRMVITCGNPSKGHLVQHLPLPVTVTWHTHVFVLKVVERTGDDLHVMSTANQLARVTVVARTPWFSWRKCVVVDEPDIHGF